jgi:hypothetical protein
MSALLVVVSSTFVDANFQVNVASVTWLSLIVIKTVYCFAWDVVMDWGLFRKGGRHALLRPSLSFSPTVYYVAIVFNLFTRASWSLAISQNFCRQSCSLLLGLCEVLRRGMWAVLRIELQALRGHAAAEVVLYRPTGAFVAAKELNEPLLPDGEEENI